MRELTSTEQNIVVGGISDKGLTAPNALNWNVVGSFKVISDNLKINWNKIGHDLGTALSKALNPWGNGSLADALIGLGRITTGVQKVQGGGNAYAAALQKAGLIKK